MYLGGQWIDPRIRARHSALESPSFREDRKINGIFLESSIADNIALPHLRRGLSRLGIVRDDAVRELARGTVTGRPFECKCLASMHERGSCPAAIEQKIVFAKAIARECRVLIADEPTQGVDVAGKEEIYSLFHRLKADGVAILMISSDLPELLRMSDEIVVMREGRLVGSIPATRDEEWVMRMASGIERESVL